ncbi:MAG: response regulator [Candidatus Omnitrophica bacterium]|nr:response regulator [Candidatus Omnitrophota bacterium]
MERKKILIIDDEKGFTELIKEVLEETGRYEVKAENEARSGFSAAKKFRPDLVLLDVVFPEMDGTSVAVQIKSDEKTKDIPIIFVTGTITPEEAAPQGIGGQFFLSKPVKMKELMKSIDERI